MSTCSTSSSSRTPAATAGRTTKGRYGGPKLENRARFLLQTVKAVREACGPDFIVASRMNVFDVHPYPYGFGVDRDDSSPVTPPSLSSS